MSNKINQIVLGIGTMLCLYSCTWDQLAPQVDCSTNAIEMELIASEDVACGDSNGSFTVSARGGQGPYTYSSEIEENTTGEFIQLTAGSYTVIATDANGCNADLTIAIQNVDGVRLDEINVSDAGCGSSNGSINISASGGQEPYSYIINGGESQESNQFTDLKGGDYTVSVQDQTGCEITQEVNISTGVSFQNSIKSIIETSCAVSGCHNGSVSPNLTTLSTIQSRASAIKSRTASGSMPRGSTLSQTEIDLIACWVDDGALDN